MSAAHCSPLVKQCLSIFQVSAHCTNATINLPMSYRTDGYQQQHACLRQNFPHFPKCVYSLYFAGLANHNWESLKASNNSLNRKWRSQTLPLLYWIFKRFSMHEWLTLRILWSACVITKSGTSWMAELRIRRETNMIIIKLSSFISYKHKWNLTMEPHIRSVALENHLFALPLRRKREFMYSCVQFACIYARGQHNMWVGCWLAGWLVCSMFGWCGRPPSFH